MTNANKNAAFQMALERDAQERRRYWSWLMKYLGISGDGYA